MNLAIRTLGSIRPPRLDLDGGRVGWCLGVWEGAAMITYALLSRGGAFGKGGRGALAYCTPMQTNRLTDRLESHTKDLCDDWVPIRKRSSVSVY